jgi:hypothetical protein
MGKESAIIRHRLFSLSENAGFTLIQKAGQILSALLA